MEKKVINWNRTWALDSRAHQNAFKAAEIMHVVMHLASYKPKHHRYSSSSAVTALRNEAALLLTTARTYNRHIARAVYRQHYKSQVQKIENQ